MRKFAISFCALLLILLIGAFAFLEETLTFSDLEEKGLIYYKKGSTKPFSGRVAGKERGSAALIVIGKFENGLQEGLWEWYDEQANLFAKGMYEQGKRVGVWNWYDKSGKVTITEEY